MPMNDIPRMTNVIILPVFAEGPLKFVRRGSIAMFPTTMGGFVYCEW